MDFDQKLIFEFMTGKRPYQGKTRKDIRDAILAKQAQIKPQDMPAGWTPEACDLANRMLQRKPQNRIGYNGIREIKEHPWLRNMNWEALIQRKIIAPFVPTTKDNFDQKQVTSEWQDEGEPVDLQQPSVQNLFAGYYYDASSQPEANTSVPT